MQKIAKDFVVATVFVLLVNARLQSQSTAGEPGSQEHAPHQHQPAPEKNMSAEQMKDMGHHAMNMEEKPTTLIEEIQQHATSGTSAEPNSTPMPMLMTMKGKDADVSW